MKESIYVAVRSDLTPEQQAVQACHACSLSGHHFGVTEQTHLVLLSVPNKSELNKLHETLLNNGIGVSIFHEPDYDIGHSALATQPLSPAHRKLFKKYKLLRFGK